MKKYTETESNLRYHWHVDNDILDALSYDMLIMTVITNEKIRNKRAVYKVFNEYLEGRIRDSKDMLELMLDKIMKEIKERVES